MAMVVTVSNPSPHQSSHAIAVYDEDAKEDGVDPFLQEPDQPDQSAARSASPEPKKKKKKKKKKKGGVRACLPDSYGIEEFVITHGHWRE